MASIKGLKKDVDCLASAVISDCINYAIYAQRHDDEVSELVNDIISYRNDIRARIADGKRVAKAEKKGRTRDEIDVITCWLTGYSKEQI